MEFIDSFIVKSCMTCIISLPHFVKFRCDKVVSLRIPHIEASQDAVPRSCSMSRTRCKAFDHFPSRNHTPCDKWSDKVLANIVATNLWKTSSLHYLHCLIHPAMKTDTVSIDALRISEEIIL